MVYNTPLTPLEGGKQAPFNSPTGGKYSPPSEGQGEVVIDISHLANGMYFLKAGNKTAKVVKE
jgi:hypothetical protein